MAEGNNFFSLNTFPGGSEKNAIDEIVKSSGLSNIKVIISAGSEKGDNYVGVVQRVKIIEEEGDKEVSLILKSSTRNSVIRDLYPTYQQFEREVFIYNEVLPEFKKLEIDFQVKNTFDSYAKLYKYSLKEMDEYLILADKKADGFTMADRKHPLDLENCKLVLKELSKFHALSFALKEHKPEKFKNYAERATHYMTQLNAQNLIREHFNNSGDKALKALMLTGDSKEIEAFTKFKDILFDIVFNFSKFEKFDQYSILLHGDCWSNNILFKYEDPANPRNATEVCFLDWQVSIYGSLAMDLSYFIYNCTSTEDRNKYFDTLLDEYYISLGENLKQFKCNIEDLFPKEVFLENVNKFSKYGVAIACSLLNLFTSDSSEIPDFQMITEFDQKVVDDWNYISKNIELYNERITGVIKHAVSRGFI